MIATPDQQTVKRVRRWHACKAASLLGYGLCLVALIAWHGWSAYLLGLAIWLIAQVFCWRDPRLLTFHQETIEVALQAAFDRGRVVERTERHRRHRTIEVN